MKMWSTLLCIACVSALQACRTTADVSGNNKSKNQDTAVDDFGEPVEVEGFEYAFSPKMYTAESESLLMKQDMLSDAEAEGTKLITESTKLIVEGRQLITESTKLIVEGGKLEVEKIELEGEKSLLLQQQIDVLQGRNQVSTQGQAAQLKALDRRLEELNQQVRAQDQKIQASDKKIQVQEKTQEQKIRMQEQKIQASDKKIQVNQDMIVAIEAWIEDETSIASAYPEQRIIDLYDWRIKKSPNEAKTRYIPERDRLLKQLREEQAQEEKNQLLEWQQAQEKENKNKR